MGDKNNNLEDFLRRKFSDIEDSEEAWTRPNLNVKNNILNQITEPSQKKRKKMLLILLLFSVLVSVGLFKCFVEEKENESAVLHTKSVKTNAKISKTKTNSSYLDASIKEQTERNSNYKNRDVATGASKEELIEQNALLRTVIQNQNDIIIQLKEDRLATKNTTTKQLITNKALSKNNSPKAYERLLDKNRVLEIEQQALKVVNEKQQKEIKLLKQEKQVLLDSLNGQIYASNAVEKAMELITEKKNNIAYPTIQPISASELEAIDATIEPLILEDNFGLDQPKRKVGFEIGYQFGMQGRMGEIIEYIVNQGEVTNQVKDKLLVSHVHGLTVGISPVKNFWIRTGAHLGNMNLYQKHNLKFIYDSNSSLTVSANAYADKINSLSQIGISTLEGSINKLANTQNAVNGDELTLNFQTNLVLTYLQIPLEFNYTYGKKRLKGLFQLGGQWNSLYYQYYIHGLETIINNQNNLMLDQQESGITPNQSNVQYWGLHAGAGLSYDISKHWNIQGLLSYEYYFHYDTNTMPSPSNTQAIVSPVSSKVPTAIANMGFGLKLGLNYRF